MYTKRFEQQKQIIVNLNSQICSEAGAYIDNNNCPIATAVKKMKGVTLVSVNPRYVKIYDSHDRRHIYKIAGSTGSALYISTVRTEGFDVPIVLNKVTQEDYDYSL